MTVAELWTPLLVVGAYVLGLFHGARSERTVDDEPVSFDDVPAAEPSGVSGQAVKAA